MLIPSIDLLDGKAVQLQQGQKKILEREDVIELAKYYEHIAKDIQKAYAYANSALRYALNTAPLHGDDDAQLESIRRRMERLRYKLSKTDFHTGGKQR